MRSPDQAVLFPHVGGAHLTQRPRPAHPTELPQDPRADTMAATRGGGAGGGSDTPPLGLGHLTDNPERSRSTAKAQAEPALAQCPRGQRDGPAGQHPHRRGGGPPARRQPQEAKARGACCVGGPHRPPPDATRQTAGAGQRGRAGFRSPVPPNAPPTGGEERQGAPAGGTRRTGPIHHECPPLARRGSVPARESTTSPHRSGKAPPRSGVGQSATASPEASEQISLTIPSPREGAADNPVETRDA